MRFLSLSSENLLFKNRYFVLISSLFGSLVFETKKKTSHPVLVFINSLYLKVYVWLNARKQQ